MPFKVAIQGITSNPPLEVLNRYLFTRKKEMIIAGIRMPGLFSIYNLHETTIGFILIFILEFSATILAIDNGLQPLMVIVLIIVDFVLAFIAHIPKKVIIESKNQLIIETNQFKTIEIEKRIQRGLRVTYFFDILIFLSAGIKIYFIWELLGAKLFSPLGIFIIVAYIIAACLHVLCTGYFIHSLYLLRQNRAAISEFKSSGGTRHVANTLRIQLDNGNYILVTGDETSPSIVKENGVYFIESPGVLSDEDLNRLVSKQINATLQINIIKKGIEMQLTSIGALVQNSANKNTFPTGTSDNKNN